MRLVTWNINSVRLRMPIVSKLVRDENPDVICLQETKVIDELFPIAAIESLGFRHLAFSGMKGYNGVAILSRLPFAKIKTKDWCKKSDCRHIYVTFESGVELHNFYVPAGGDVPDPTVNEKFSHKLAFLDDMKAWFAKKSNEKQSRILVGDLNIAPLETDVWSHKQLLKVVSHTPMEVEKLAAVQKSLGWVDAVRHLLSEEEKLYSWWSYRSRDWAESDRGRRLDHVWVTPKLVESLKGAQILRHARGWEKPSDHVPVMVDFDHP
jgi:exodeoxyribonuclease III